jgi:hypothetical protein
MNTIDNISISHIAAALETKIKNQTEILKKEDSDLRLDCCSRLNDFRLMVLAEIEKIKSNHDIVNGMVALFPSLRGSISITYSVSENRYAPPDCFVDYKTQKLDFRSKTYYPNVIGRVVIKNYEGQHSFNFNPRFKLPKSKKLVALITAWQNSVDLWKINQEKFKKLAKIKDNFNNECSLIHLQLTAPAQHKTLVEFVDSYIDRQ